MHCTSMCLQEGSQAGTTWPQREALGRAARLPPGWWLGLQLVLCLSSPDAWASLPTWCPEGMGGFPCSKLSKLSRCSTDSRGLRFPELWELEHVSCHSIPPHLPHPS